MFTLSDASKDVKQLLKFLGIFIASIILILLIIRLVFFIKNFFYPTPPPKPELAFGKLQAQVFPLSNLNKNFTYSINTLTGSLPALESLSKVYRMQTLTPDLLAVNKFEDKIRNAGFEKGSIAISDKVFEWKSNNNSGEIEKRIRFNIVNNNFTITSSYLTDSDILQSFNLPTQTKAIDMASEFLNNMQLMPEDIDLEKNKINLFSIQNGFLISATSLSNSQIIEVNFFQKDINKLPIFYEKPNSSNISILIAGGKYQGQIVGANFIHQTATEESSTYPLKPVGSAFNELKNGQAYIASYYGTSTEISISNVFLAYYIGKGAQDFLMPIIVFEGNDGFFAYVSAVTDEWINK